MGDSSSNYLRLLPLARGGMGEVELALRKQGSFERLYAIKRLRDAFQHDASVREMFVIEARLAGMIRHPNVVGVLDVGEDERGPFLAMEYVAGLSVAALVRALASADRALPLPFALRIVADAARGLHAAHELTRTDGSVVCVVHRDVSPQNILVGFVGEVKITDFGVAKIIGHIAGTQTGLLKGKMGYMSPEQLRFEVLDRRADVFALGVVLFELLAGRRLYPPDGQDELAGVRRILGEPPPDIGEERDDVPPEIVALTMEMLSKEKDHRPSTMKEIAGRLDACRVRLEADLDTPSFADWLAHELAGPREAQRTAIREAIERVPAPVADDHRAPPRSTPPASSEAPRARRWPLVALALVALVALGVGGVALATSSTSDHRAPLGGTAPAAAGVPIAAPSRAVDPPLELSRSALAPPLMPPEDEATAEAPEELPSDPPRAARRRHTARHDERALEEPMGWGNE